MWSPTIKVASVLEDVGGFSLNELIKLILVAIIIKLDGHGGAEEGGNHNIEFH